MAQYVEEVHIRGDGSHYERALASATGKTTTATKTWSQSFFNFGSVVKGIVAIQVIRWLAQFTAAIVEAASSQEEALNAMRVTFGAAADSVEDFAFRGADAFNVSQTAALSYTATLGGILQASGLVQQAAADMSIELVKRAADLASLKDLEIPDALEKIRAGLVGEVEPLRTVGVLLSEAVVQQEAYTSGIAEVGEKLTDAQKVQARYNIIMEQTAVAQGDVANTAGSVANQERGLRQTWEDNAATLGKRLQPAIAELQRAIIDLIPVLTLLAEKVATGAGWFARAVAEVGSWAAFLDRVSPLISDVGHGTNDFNTALQALAMTAGTLTLSDLTAEIIRLSDETMVGFGNEEELAAGLRRIFSGSYGSSVEDVTAQIHELGERTGVAFLNEEALARALGAGEIAAEAAVSPTEELAQAHEDVAAAAREQRAAELALVGGLLGLVSVAQDVADAEKELERLRKKGKEGTFAYRDAVQVLLEAGVNLEASFRDQATAMIEDGVAQGQLEQQLIKLGRRFGLTRGEVLRLIDDLGVYEGKLNRLDGKIVDTTVRTTFVTSGTPQQGAGETAAGGIVRAAHGLITRGPTILAGEGSYPTFAGRGAEAVIPLNTRGIGILSKAMSMALGDLKGRGPGEVHLHFEGGVFPRDGRDFAQDVIRIVRDELMADAR